MRYFYTTKNNKIESYTSFNDTDTIPQFILNDFTETDREIVRIHDGSLMFADEVDQQAEAQAIAEQEKAKAIAELNAEYEQAKSQLIAYLGEATMLGADDIVEELKAEYASIQEQYDAQEEME